MVTTMITQEATIEEIHKDPDQGSNSSDPQSSKGKQNAVQPLGGPTPGPSSGGGGGDDPGDDNSDPSHSSNRH